MRHPQAVGYVDVDVAVDVAVAVAVAVAACGLWEALSRADAVFEALFRAEIGAESPSHRGTKRI